MTLRGDSTGPQGEALLLFDEDRYQHPAYGASAAQVRLQGRIRELNDERRAHQDPEVARARRRAAVARLRRRLADADEVEFGYWEQRRSRLGLVR